MRVLYIGAVLFIGRMFGQEIAPGILRGQITEIMSVTPARGTVEVQSEAGVRYRCFYDDRTWIERGRRRTSIHGLDKAENVEMITDARVDRCYARTIQVREAALVPIARPSSRPPIRPVRSVLDHLFPRGNLTFAGVILRLSPEMMVVRTRADGEKMVLLREDTRYLNSGLPVEASGLVVNTRVFVRGGRNMEDHLEAYQIIWGAIEGPSPGMK